MSHTPKTPTPSYTTANLPTDLPDGSVVFDSDRQKLVSFKSGSWNTLGGVGSTTYVRYGSTSGLIDQIDGDIPDNWKFGHTSLSGLVIGTSCKVIGDSAFRLCTGLHDSLIIPESVTTIKKYAFYACGFDGTLTINKNVASIGAQAFYDSPFVNVDCYVQKDILDHTLTLFNTNVSTIHVRSTDTTWTAGSGQTIGGKTGITVIKDL